MPHTTTYYYVSRQHGKDVGARVVSRQAPAATSTTRRSEVFVWRCNKSVFPAVSRLSSPLAGNYGAEDGAVGRYRGFDVQPAPGSLPEAEYGRDRRVRGLEILRNYPAELHSRGDIYHNDKLIISRHDD